METTGVIVHATIVLDRPCSIPEGTRVAVRVEPVQAPAEALAGTAAPPLKEAAGEEAGTAEDWDRKNARRIELAKRKVRVGLSATEEAEFAELQAAVVAYVEGRFPRQSVVDGRLETLEAKHGIVQKQ